MTIVSLYDSQCICFPDVEKRFDYGEEGPMIRTKWRVKGQVAGAERLRNHQEAVAELCGWPVLCCGDKGERKGGGGGSQTSCDFDSFFPPVTSSTTPV